jgi:predicted metal-dependent hydrolase
MIVEQRQIMYGQTAIEFQVERRDRKTLEIGVEPDLRVTIAAPMNADSTQIDAKVRKRAAWIKRQQAYFRQFLPRAPLRKYVGGETHLYLGRQYRLKIELALVDHVRFYRGYIHVHSTRPHNEAHTKKLVLEWYKERARIKFEERLKHCVGLFSRPEVFTPRALIVRKLELRWGSMSAAHRLLLNRRLIEAPVDAIDYVITHELCHIQELHHGPKFYELLSSSMPDWENRKAKLERLLA